MSGTRVAVARRDAERLVAEARRNRIVRVLARSGYAASAVLRILIGVFALLLAAHAPGPHADASGVFGAIARVPGGVVLLILLAAGELALGVWLLVAGTLHRDQHGWERWRRRLIDWGRAPVYLVIGAIALRVALGARGGSDRQASRHLLDVPGGAVVLALIGAVIAVAGLSMAWIGVRRRYRRTIRLPRSRARRTAVDALAVTGYGLEGLSIAAVGVLLALAAFTLDAAGAVGLNDTLGAFTADPLGRAFLVLMAVGWIAAGLYAGVRAVLARLE